MDLAQLTTELRSLRDEAVAAARDADGSDVLAERELDYLGKKGRLTVVLRGIGALPAEDRPKVGAIANEIQTEIRDAFAAASAAIRSRELGERLVSEATDVTTPGRPIRRGTYHPIPATIERIAAIFGQFGFQVYEGPEVEDDRTNFQMLNIPPDHPSRDLWDTLYVEGDGKLLRTHTSPGQ
ncbi:MAG TPA: phenylalanine--tRNA ligase subunit alpha, partial [Candidatus Limnocylindrales bacterium]